MDFVCLESRLVIELDGGQHLDSVEYDAERTAYLDNCGYSVIRFWNNQVLTEINGVTEAILLALIGSLEVSPHPSHPPSLREGVF